MRVLHVYAGNLYGGVEAMLSAIAHHRYLAPEMDQRFALFFEGRLARELGEAGAEPEILGQVRLSRPWTRIQAGRRLRGVLRRFKPQVVICHSSWSHAIAAPVARRANIPVVFWLHDVIGRPTRVDRRAMRERPAHVVCTSAFAKASLPNLFPHVRSDVVYPPVSPPLPDLGRQRAAVRMELPAASDDVVVAQVARMEEWKGHRQLLEALGRLKGLPGWTLWQVGGAQRRHERRYLETLGKLAIRLGIGNRVIVAGERKDARRVLAAADVLCQPNLGPEPFGIAVVEALYAGLPVVATAVGGPAETVDESCGVLVPPDDVDALAQALRSLITDHDLRRRLSEGGPARARALCDPEQQLRRLHSILSDVVHG